MISKNLVFVDDILYYDGPLMSLFQEKDDVFIVFALSLESEYERFAFVKSQKEDTEEFLSGDIDLLDLLKVSKSIVTFETINVYERETWNNLSEISFKEMDSKDLPNEGLYIKIGLQND